MSCPAKSYDMLDIFAFALRHRQNVPMDQLKQGQLVEVKAFGGENLIRRVVADLGKTVIVSAEREFEDAISCGKQPRGVGFPRADVKAVG